MPPGWQDVVDASLVEVRVLQWLTAHQATLDTVAATGLETHRVRYEDLVGPAARREAAAKALAAELGYAPDPATWE